MDLVFDTGNDGEEEMWGRQKLLFQVNDSFSHDLPSMSFSLGCPLPCCPLSMLLSLSPVLQDTMDSFTINKQLSISTEEDIVCWLNVPCSHHCRESSLCLIHSTTGIAYPLFETALGQSQLCPVDAKGDRWMIGCFGLLSLLMVWWRCLCFKGLAVANMPHPICCSIGWFWLDDLVLWSLLVVVFSCLFFGVWCCFKHTWQISLPPWLHSRHCDWRLLFVSFAIWQWVGSNTIDTTESSVVPFGQLLW
jgi:hypothetical protein